MKADKFNKDLIKSVFSVAVGLAVQDALLKEIAKADLQRSRDTKYRIIIILLYLTILTLIGLLYLVGA